MCYTVPYHFIWDVYLWKTLPSCYQVFLHLWYFNKSNEVSFWKKKITIKQKTEGCESLEGLGGGERGMAITGSDEGERVHYWQLCPLWARQRRIHKERNDMKEGQSQSESKPVNHFKGLWGWHLYILRLSPFANIPRPQKTLIVFDVILFIIIKVEGAWEEKTFGLLWSHNSS